MLGPMVVMAMFKIVRVGDEALTTVSADGKVWLKKYDSVPDATAEAVELLMMEPHTKPIVDGAQRQPTWPQGGYQTTTPREVDLEELKARGFVLGS
jgi:hypothetical protein